MRNHILATMLLLSACADRIERPTANPGEAPAAPAVGDPIQLEGSGSTDPQERPLTFLWSFTGLPAGSQTTLHDPLVANPSFLPDVAGSYVVELIVSNGVLDSEPVSLAIDVTACGSGVPVVDAAQATPAAPATAQIVQLSAMVSDGDNAKPCSRGEELFYRWDLVELPLGSLAEIAAPTARNPSFAPDVPGSYGVELVVTDSTGRSSDPAIVTVEAAVCGTNPPVPGALVATPSAPATGQPVQLSAPAAADADIDAGCGLAQTLSHQWALTATPSGSLATLNDPTSTLPSFTPDVVGTYSVRLTLTDSTGRSRTSTLDVTAGPCGSNPPVALISMSNPVTTAAGNAVFAPDVAVGTDVQLDAGASSDADQTGCGLSDPLSYSWAFERLAAASNASFNAAIVNPSFTTDRPGTYIVRLTVTDSTGLFDTATLQVTADPCVLLALPVEFACTTVRSGQPQGLDQPHGVTVDATGNIYVVNQGTDNVVRIVPGAISVFAEGGLLNGGGLEDIVFFSGATDSFFVTDSTDDEIVQLSTTGLPTLFADGGAVQQPMSIANFADCSTTDWLLVASFGNDEILGFDPTDTPPAGSLFNDLMTTAGGADLATQPRGVAAQCQGAADQIYATRSGGPDGLVRDEADIPGIVDTAQTMSTNAIMNRPRDVVLTPCATPKAVVAAGGGNAIVVVDDCGGGGCPLSVLASGLDQVYGLWFESNSSLLVTDPGSDTLFRITANNPAAFDFCDL